MIDTREIHISLEKMINEIDETFDNIDEIVGDKLHSGKFVNKELRAIVSKYVHMLMKEKKIIDEKMQINDYQTCADLSWDSRKQQILDILDDREFEQGYRSKRYR